MPLVHKNNTSTKVASSVCSIIHKSFCYPETVATVALNVLNNPYPVTLNIYSEQGNSLAQVQTPVFFFQSAYKRRCKNQRQYKNYIDAIGSK